MNTLLANIDHCEDAAAVKEYSALAKFWRAYYYADMVRKFGDVPWIDHEIGSADEDLYSARDSRETILNHMIEDIDEAILNLPGKAKAPQTAYRVNKYTALMLKAQFCLFEGTFRKYHGEPAPFATSYTAADGSTHDYKYYLNLAAEAAGDLMASGAYSIHNTGNPSTDYLTLFNANDASTDEIILAVNYDAGLGIKHDCSREITNQTAARFGMAKKLVDMYLMADGSRFTDIPGWEVMPFAEEVSAMTAPSSNTARPVTRASSLSSPMPWRRISRTSPTMTCRYTATRRLSSFMRRRRPNWGPLPRVTSTSPSSCSVTAWACPTWTWLPPTPTPIRI